MHSGQNVTSCNSTLAFLAWVNTCNLRVPWCAQWVKDLVLSQAAVYVIDTAVAVL